MKITATIERNEEGLYAITCEESVSGCNFGGFGYSVEEAKADFMESIRESLEVVVELGKEVPVSVEEIEVIFR